MNITLQNTCSTPDVPTRKLLQNWIETTLKQAPKKTSLQNLTIRFVTQTESAELNQTYRKKSGPTNVLSFPDEPIPGFDTESLGDLAICSDLVAEEALAQGKTLEAHWAHLTLHGVLHLLGYDHINEKDANEMESLEIDILKAFGFTNPYE